MYATIRTYTGGSAFAEAIDAHESEVRDIISVIDGFRAYYLVNTEDGTATVSVFDTQDGAEKSTEVAAAWVAANLADISPGPPQVISGDVLINF